MDLVSTPEPHFIPGYTGHCPQYLYRVGKTYGKLTHTLLVSPSIPHSANIAVTMPTDTKLAKDKPTQNDINVVNEHENESDAVLKYPIIPGYDGFIPNLHSKIGDRFLAAATAGVAEHERHMNLLKCEQRNLKHRNLLESGQGLFGRNLGEISMQRTNYQLPLIPVRKEGAGRKLVDGETFDRENYVPYSKHTTPHFMENNDPEKYIKTGYAAHVPMTFKRIGEDHQTMTSNALGEFSKDYKHRLIDTKGTSVTNEAIMDIMEATSDSFVIYPKDQGMIPCYAGHVPGEMFQIGTTYGKHTVDAKRCLIHDCSA